MASDARLRRPTVLTRSGDYVFTYIEFYGATTTATIELRAYDSSGTQLYYPFTDPDSLQTVTSSGILGPSGYQSRVITVTWLFSSSALSAQATSFHIYLYANGVLIDYW